VLRDRDRDGLGWRILCSLLMRRLMLIGLWTCGCPGCCSLHRGRVSWLSAGRTSEIGPFGSTT